MCGMVTIAPTEIPHLRATGDTRWIHRAAYDRMGFDPEATGSGSGMPRSRSLYGSLPEQLADENSFVSNLREILATRKRYGIATGLMLDVPPVAHKAMLVIVNQLQNEDEKHVLVLNFSAEELTGTVISAQLVPNSLVYDMTTEHQIGDVSALSSFIVTLPSFGGLSLLVREETVDEAADQQSGDEPDLVDEAPAA